MVRRPPRSTLDRSSAASDVYKRQVYGAVVGALVFIVVRKVLHGSSGIVANTKASVNRLFTVPLIFAAALLSFAHGSNAVSYTHLRAHETVLDLVCRLLLEKKIQAFQCPSRMLLRMYPLG